MAKNCLIKSNEKEVSLFIFNLKRVNSINIKIKDGSLIKSLTSIYKLN